MNPDSAHVTGIKNTPENREKCHCTFCPSYPHDCPDELLYCSIGASKCEVPVNGFICYTCPIL
jgi:hypothetical protein